MWQTSRILLWLVAVCYWLINMFLKITVFYTMLPRLQKLKLSASTDEPPGSSRSIGLEQTENFNQPFLRFKRQKRLLIREKNAEMRNETYLINKLVRKSQTVQWFDYVIRNSESRTTSYCRKFIFIGEQLNSTIFWTISDWKTTELEVGKLTVIYLQHCKNNCTEVKI